MCVNSELIILNCECQLIPEYSQLLLIKSICTFIIAAIFTQLDEQLAHKINLISLKCSLETLIFSLIRDHHYICYAKLSFKWRTDLKNPYSLELLSKDFNIGN